MQMTPQEYFDAISDVGMTQVGAARFFGIDGRTSRKWVAGTNAVPPAVSMLLRVMLRYNLTPLHVQNIAPREGRKATVVKKVAVASS
jgi:hypothetical protein